MNTSESKKQPDKIKITLWTKLNWKYALVMSKVKKLKFDRERITINFFIILAFLSILIGIVIFVFFLYKASAQYTIQDNNIALDRTSQVGDFIGGVVGSIWALTGVLLFYATLRLQSKELAENRKHFQISRLTDVIYKQLGLFNEQVANFKLKDIEKDENGNQITHTGRSAVLLLRNRVESSLNIVKNQEDSKPKETFEYMAENFVFIEINKNSLLHIYEELANQVSIVKAILIKKDIEPADLNELKSMFSGMWERIL